MTADEAKRAGWPTPEDGEPRPGGSAEAEQGEPVSPLGPDAPAEQSSPEPADAEDSGARRGRFERPKIPGYQVKGVLGKGSTGVVYRAVQLAVERPVALKVLHPELVGTKRAIRRLQREARTAARLAHPAIISAIDMGEIDGQWWYAMELIEGRPLSRLIEDGPLGEREALRYFSALCDGLQHAFEAGVVHRDIKPANILIDEGGHARLVDLGLAFAEDDPMLTRTGGTLGTPHYISPEQAKSPGAADTRSDIWSLGATLFHTVCGEPPFQGESVAEILSSVLYGRIPDPRRLQPKLSRGLALVLRKCLARDPDNRYQQPVELLRDMERLRERRNPLVRASSLDPVASQRAAWVRQMLLGALVLVPLLLLGRFALGELWQQEDVSDGGSNLRHPVVVDIERGLEQESFRPAVALARLDALSLEARSSHDAQAARIRVENELRARLRALVVDVTRTFEDALAGREFPRARSLITSDIDRRLRRNTGFESLGALPAGIADEFQDWRVDLDEQLEASVQGAIGEAEARLLAYLEDVARPEIELAESERRWRDALALLSVPRDGWLDAADVDRRGLRDEQLDRVMNVLRVDLELTPKRMRTSWYRAVDPMLSRWLDQRFAELSAKLEADRLTGAAALLERQFSEHLVEIGVDLEQIPETWDRPSLQQLDRHVEALTLEESFLRTRIAQFLFEDLEETSSTLCARRDYAAALVKWRDALRRRTLADVREDVQVRILEMQLLGAVLRRTEEALRERHDQLESLLQGSVFVEGRLIAVGDILTDGVQLEFDVKGGHSRARLFLVAPPEGLRAGHMLATGDIDRLVSWDMKSDTDPIARALLWFYDGDPRKARQHLPIQAEGDYDAVVRDLRERVSEASRIVEEREADRSERMRLRIRALKAERSDDLDWRARAALATAFGELLREYAGDLDADERGELERLQAELARLPSISELYAPDEDGQARGTGRHDLTWRFASPPGRAWNTGLWSFDGEGLSLEQALGTSELLAPGTGPTLLLDPLLVYDESITARFRLDPRVSNERFDRLVIVSVAGYNAVLLDEGEDHRFLVGTAELAVILDALDRGEGDPYPGGIPGQVFDLSVTVKPKQGRVELKMAGEVLRPRQQRYPDPDLTDARLALRSSQPLRVLEIALEGRFRSQ